jgi:hypothetical protein
MPDSRVHVATRPRIFLPYGPCITFNLTFHLEFTIALEFGAFLACPIWISGGWLF